MQVECNSIEQFCRELQHELEYVHDSVVRVRVDATPEQEEELTFEVVLHASCIVAKQTGDWLLKFSGVAGMDSNEYESGDDRATSGTVKAEIWVNKIRKVLGESGVRLGEGKIEV